MGEELETLVGHDEARIAHEILEEERTEVLHRVMEEIASHRRSFEARPENEQSDLRQQAKEDGEKLAFHRHHRVTCPSCGSTATIRGQAFGKEFVSADDDKIIIRQAVMPRLFQCPSCELKLEGYAELEAANLGGQYSRTTSFTPDEYYGLVHPDDIGSYFDEEMAGLWEYDNE
jgi:ribosomal protein L37AE/L43A